MRVVISGLQQKLKDGSIEDIKHVSSKEQLADILTKKGVNNNLLVETLEKGYLPHNSEDLEIRGRQSNVKQNK